MTPVLTDLGEVAPDINRFIAELGPFSTAATPALVSLGEAGEVGGPALQRALPVIKDTRTLAAQLKPVARLLGDLLVDFERENGLQRVPRLHLLPGDRGQRLRLLRPLPARRAARQPVHDVRDGADRRLLGELPAGGRLRGRGRGLDAARPGARVDAPRALRRRRRRLPATRPAATAARAGKRRRGAIRDGARRPTPAPTPAPTPDGRPAAPVTVAPGATPTPAPAPSPDAAPADPASDPGEPLLDYLFGSPE